MTASRFAAAVSVGAAVLSFAGCTPRVYCPPSRIWSHETPGTIGQGNNSVSAAGGIHIFHVEGSPSMTSIARLPHGISGVIGYKRGIGDNLDARADFTLFGLTHPRDEGVLDKPFLGALRLSGKYNPPWARRFLSVWLGAGGGTSMMGQYATIDEGLVLGFENPYVVPFAAAGFFTSFPFNTKWLLLDTDPDPGDDDFNMTPQTRYYDRPEITWGPEFSGGFKFLTARWGGDKRLSFGLTYTFLMLIDDDSHESQSAAGGFVELAF